jgi:hypothetical protein
MPVSYRFDSNIVIIDVVGEYSMDDLRATILNSLADPEHPANTFLLINMEESRSILERSSAEVKAMARFVASLGERFNNRIAMVASGNLAYGLMRMGSAGSEEKGIKSNVFRTFAEAQKWLLS